MSDPSVTDLVEALYAALVAGDREAIGRLLTDDFVGVVTEGLPSGIGGTHRGREAMIEEVWWPIGRAFRVRPEPAEWIPCADGRLLVLGRYVGKGRESGVPIDAAFAHLWTAHDNRLSALWQLTDSELFTAALR